MLYFAEVINGKVNQVIFVNKIFITMLPNVKNWIETDPNTRGNLHYIDGTNILDNKKPIRGNFARVGYIYDYDNDVFYPPAPYPSWVINKATWLWLPPVPRPLGLIGQYFWNESNQSWIKQILIPFDSVPSFAIPENINSTDFFVEIVIVNAQGTSVIYQDEINSDYPFTKFVPREFS
jgi:hypothetical protein